MRIRWREFELPNRVIRDEAVSNANYALFVAEPFERGFGHTVGNGLRRVLLSSLEGSAVTHVRVQGAPHEFSTIDGVVEDMTEIVLNVKRLLVRSESSEPRQLRLRATKKGAVTASLFEETQDVSILNKDLYLCTIAKDGVTLEMEITVRRGRGFVTAEENYDAEMELGVIPVDSLFSPVVRVRHSVTATRVGKMTNYDKLSIEIWTNGTVSPDEALVESSKIYRKHLNAFVLPGDTGGSSAAAGLFSGIGEASAPSAPSGAASSAGGASSREVLSRPISSLELSVRAANCMREEGIETVADLCRREKDELLNVKNFGKTTLKEIEKKLEDLGLSLDMDVDAVLKG
ncbi:MAG: DNA-directed RNA polymerase subunit alpha [Planctomycetes bacterium]|nr:DNA-directed RNA polymerase subunit alpha [Planctomycetota bacterium]